MKRKILSIIFVIICTILFSALSACNYNLDCFYENCDNPICEKSNLYCEEHVCQADDCGLKAKQPPYGRYCSDHECKNSNCEKQRLEISRSTNLEGKLEIIYCNYCSLHKCHFENCYSEGYLEYEGKNLCVEHFYQSIGLPLA